MSTSNKINSPRPTNLPEALVRIEELESKLAHVGAVLRSKTGIELDDLLQRWGGAGPQSTSSPTLAPPASSLSPALPSPIALHTSPFHPPTSKSIADQGAVPEAVTEEPKEVDVSQLVLKALLLRKKIANGSLDESEGQLEAGRLVEGLKEEQAQLIREYAGM